MWVSFSWQEIKGVITLHLCRPPYTCYRFFSSSNFDYLSWRVSLAWCRRTCVSSYRLSPQWEHWGQQNLLLSEIPRRRLKSRGDRASSALAPNLWRSLSFHIRDARCLIRTLKTYFFFCCCCFCILVWFDGVFVDFSVCQIVLFYVFA